MYHFVILKVLTLLLISSSLHADDDFDPSTLVLDDDVVNLVLPKKCAAGETWKNESSSGKKLYCTIQKGHFSDELSQIVNDAETVGCKVDKRVIKYIADNFNTAAYAANPLYKRAGEDCGMCGLKPACCGTKNAEVVAAKVVKEHSDLKNFANPFYFQTLKTHSCSYKSVQACSYKPLTPDEFTQLEKLQKFTKNINKSDDCNFAQFGFSEWEEAKSSPVYALAKPMLDKFLCRIFQTTKPRFNCVKDHQTNQCMCCCYNNFPKQSGTKWMCVQKNDGKYEAECSST